MPDNDVTCAQLKKALMSGAREIQTGDKRVVYRSLDEMRQIYESCCGSLNPEAEAAQQTPSLATSVGRFCRGGR